MKKVNLNKISDVIEENWKFPNHLITGSMLVTMCGSQDVLIENYQGILEYDEKRIKIKSKKEMMIFTGEHLSIHYYTKEELRISGIIMKIEIQTSV